MMLLMHFECTGAVAAHPCIIFSLLLVPRKKIETSIAIVKAAAVHQGAACFV
jgi:hypothetical protein